MKKLCFFLAIIWSALAILLFPWAVSARAGQGIVNISVTPADSGIKATATIQFTATGTYSDGTVHDITASVTWTSSDAGIATVNASGLATGITAGSVVITAVSGALSDNASLKVGFRFGMGVDYASPWATQITFVNVFRQADVWNAYQLGTNVWMTQLDDIGLTLNAKGYPDVSIPFDHDGNPSTNGYVVNTIVFFGAGNRYPGGNYTLKFRGEGTVSLDWDAGQHPERGYSAIPKRYTSSGVAVEFTVPVQPNIGIKIQIDASNAANPIDDIQLLLPGYGQSETINPHHPYYPPFITGLNGFEVVRVMNFLGTNEVVCDDPSHVPSDRNAYKNCTISWGNRISQDYYTQALWGRGMAWELVIDMVNHVADADIWVNVPHAADDDYVRRLATLLRNRLHNNRRIYVEWSNEVWNISSAFPQHMWFEDRGADAFPGDNPQTAASKYYVKGLLKIFGIFEEVFAGQENRIVRVLNSQQGNVWRTNNLLSYLEDRAINPGLAGTVNAVAVGAYFGWSLIEGPPYVSPPASTLLANARAHVTQIPLQVRTIRQAIDEYINRTGRSSPISLLAYEGGAHITPMSTSWEFLGLGINSDNIDWTSYAEANRHPEMYDIYLDWGRAWFENGGDLMVAFSYVAQIPGTYLDLEGKLRIRGTSVFGHSEFHNQSLATAPKLRAIRYMMNSNNNGRVDALDLTLLAYYAANPTIYVPSATLFKLDFNSNFILDAGDWLWLADYLVGNRTSLP